MKEEKSNTLDRIRQLIPINELPNSVQTAFLKKTVMLTLPEGDCLFNKGDMDPYSYYLIEGKIELREAEGNSCIEGSGKDARYAIAHVKPRKGDAVAVRDSVILKVMQSELEDLIMEYEDELTGSYGLTDPGKAGNAENNDEADWMLKVLQSELFARLPSGNIQKMFSLVEPMQLEAGEDVIRQDDPGEHYYIIQEGKCEVLRKPRQGAKDLKLSVLHAGDSFGEEALFTEAPRNATVRMLTDGIIMKLGKQDFMDLIKDPVLQPVSYEDAVDLVEIGNGQWLDVRFENEYENSAIEGSINLPINILRMKAGELPRDRQYIAYCDSGGRSQTATFLLTGMGFDVCYLEGGLNNCSKSMEIELTETNAVIKATLDTKPRSNPDRKHDGVKKQGDKTDIKDLNAEKEAIRLRKREEAIIEKMQDEAEKLLRDEEERIKSICIMSEEKVAKLEARRHEMMEKVEQKNQAIEKASEEARLKNEEYQKICRELEDESRATDLEHTQQIAELQKRLQVLEKEKLKVERQVLAERITIHQDEVIKAQMEMEIAEMEHEKARNDAALVVENYRKKYAHRESIAKNTLTIDRKELEMDQMKVQRALAILKDAGNPGAGEAGILKEENSEQEVDELGFVCEG